MMEWIYDKFGFWYHRTNWHKYPPISQLMCWLGRHDFEPVDPGIEVTGRSAWITLKCFYCDHRKNSSFPKGS